MCQPQYPKQQEQDPDIIARAKEIGLFPCPAEVGPALRLQYIDQQAAEDLCVIMEPIDGEMFEIIHGSSGLFIQGTELSTYKRFVNFHDPLFIFQLETPLCEISYRKG